MKLEQEFFVGAHDVDRDKKVTNKALLEMLSDISMLHGAKSGHTKTVGVSPISWIVLGWKMRVIKRPPMFSTLRAVTWVRDYTRVRAGRDYIIYDENDEIVVKATAEWVAQDVEKGLFMRLTPELMAPFDPEPENCLFPGVSFPQIRKIDLDVDRQQEMEIHRMMYDYNGHVHNSIYVNLAEQILPEELYHHRFNEVEVFYKLEITSEDKVLLEYTAQEDKHVIVVREIENRGIHAVVYFSDI